MSTLEVYKKEEHITCKVNRRKVIIIRTEINGIKSRKSIEDINKIEIQLSKKINKIDNPLGSLNEFFLKAEDTNY